MNVENAVRPSKSQQTTEAPAVNQPIYMVNMLKFKTKAEYKDGRDTDITGRQAYHRYAAATSGLLAEHNAEVVFVGDVTQLTLGYVEDLWDEVAIVKYNSRDDLHRMIASPQWQEASVHRAAGLEGQLNIETISPFNIQGIQR